MKKLTKKEKNIVKEFVEIIEKYKDFGPMKLAKLMRISFELSSN